MTRFITHTIEHRDDSDPPQVVVENVVDWGTPPEGWHRFLAPVQFAVPGHNAMAQGFVPLPADTLHEAFEMCRDRINAAMPEMQRSAAAQVRKKQQQRIVVPGGGIPDDIAQKQHNGLKLSR